MFTALLTPVMNKVYPCEMEEVRHNTQKEKRIIDTLEPIINQHKLVVDKAVVMEDNKAIQQYPEEIQKEYSLFYQMTHLTKDRNCLSHDDKLDSLAIAVAACLDMLAVDVDKLIMQREEEEYERLMQELYGDGSEVINSGWFDL